MGLRKFVAKTIALSMLGMIACDTGSIDSLLDPHKLVEGKAIYKDSDETLFGTPVWAYEAYDSKFQKYVMLLDMGRDGSLEVVSYDKGNYSHVFKHIQDYEKEWDRMWRQIKRYEKKHKAQTGLELPERDMGRRLL